MDRSHVVTPGGDARIVHVREGSLTFEINPAARQDTGLPLDLRPIREMLGEMAAGKRFLSLGSYAGVPAAYAAAGGAASTTTIDGASSYLDWAERNLKANGFAGKRHRLERSLRQGTTFDLVYADVSALAGLDAADLATLLAPNGTVILVGGPHATMPDMPGLSVEDATARTIPHDFERTPKIHRCWLLRR